MHNPHPYTTKDLSTPLSTPLTTGRFVFWGSFHLSAIVLEHLMQAGYIPSAVICSPDKPSGRNHTLTPPAVKQLILSRAWPLDTWQPTSPLDAYDALVALHADFFIVMGYPHIIPKRIITLPRLGTIGVHPSLLPLYRGASPIQSVLLQNEKKTGVTLYHMDEKMDNGPLYAQSELEIGPDDTNETLGHTLAHVAGDLLVKTLPSIIAGTITAQEQEHHRATTTRKFTTADAQVDMVQNTPAEIYHKIRAFTPEPGVWTMNYPGREGVRVKILAATMNDGLLIPTLIQPAGKQAMKP